MLKKIRIRLTDPHIPDSYVCEILENTVDGESNCTPLEDITLKNALRPIRGLKLKNYFEVLMSNEYRKNFKINPVDEGNKNQGKMTISNNDSKEKFQVKKVDSHCKQLRPNDSSDDETLFQIKKKCKFINDSPQSENVYHNKIINEIEIPEETEKIFDSPKIMKSNVFKKHQNTNILNYFPSSENKKEVQIIKFDQVKKVTDIDKHKEKQPNLLKTDEKNSTSKADKKNIKLAPLFIKKEKKVIDPDVQKDRNDFLHKRLPLPKNLKINRHMEFSENFTSTLHVQQRDDNIYWLKRDILLPFHVAPDKEIGCEVIVNKIFRLNICRNNRIIDKKVNSGSKNNFITSTESLKKLKSKYKNLNLDVVIDKLKQKQDEFMQLSCDIKSSKSINEEFKSDKMTKDDLNFELFNTLWTDKYKPSSNEILGNENTVKRLKMWLQNWKDFVKELKSFSNAQKKNRETDDNEDDNESDYFVDSDEENLGLKAPCNICTLSGPNGCGKTALVFALAAELEFNIVEINSSCKRSGKHVLAYFQEATQSHKVHRVVSHPMVELKQQNQKNKRRKKKKTKKPIDGKILEEEKDSKISLLLIEDADVVFEDKDDGFYGAIASLVQTSKRPFIFISNDSSHTLMDNLKLKESLALKMKYPPFFKTCAVLDIISVLEGNPTNKKLIEFIVQRNHCDLRKSLLDLQFWDGADRESLMSNSNFDLGELWWGSFNFLHRRSLKHFGEIAGVKRKRQNYLFDCDDNDDEVEVKKLKQDSENKSCAASSCNVVKSKPNMRLYFEILEVMSTVDLIGNPRGEEPIPNRSHRVKDSLSLEEKLENINWTEEEMKKNLTEELINLSARAFMEGSKFVENDERQIKMEIPSWEEIRWRKSQEDARQELSTRLPVTNGTDGRSIHLDYLPIMRNICRTEKNRSMTNSKRKNRFCHYFNSSSELSEKNLEISQRVFSC